MLKTVTQSHATRKFVASAMLATTVSASNANALNICEDLSTTNQIEVVSKSGADALKTNTFTYNPIKHRHNKDLDKLYIKSCETNKFVKDKKDKLDVIYGLYGAYGATVELQRDVDSVYMEKMFNSFLGHYSLSETVREKAKQKFEGFREWQNEVYYPELAKSEMLMYSEQQFPDLEKVTSVIDNHINNSGIFSKEDAKIYYGNSNKFKSRQVESDNEKAKFDLLAYKVHLLNVLAFHNYIKENEFPESSLLQYYFAYDFVNGKGFVKPE